MSIDVAAQAKAGAEAAAVASDSPTMPTPRTAGGHPDLNGTWDNGRSAFGFASVDPKASICLFGCQNTQAAPAAPRPAPEFPTYKSEFLAKVKDLNERQTQEDPAFVCRPPGVPRIGPPDKIIQTPGQVVFLYDDLSGGFFRIIPTDGRPHRTDVDSSYLGDSIGRWEGDTLVVEARNFNEDTWLIDDGAFHTSKLRVIERLRRVGNTIEYDVTAEDPDVLAKPWARSRRMLTLTDQELADPAPCVEVSSQHLVTTQRHRNER